MNTKDKSINEIRSDVDEIIDLANVGKSNDMKTSEYINLMINAINGYKGSMPEILVGLMARTLTHVCINDVVDTIYSFKNHYASAEETLKDVYYNTCLYFIHAVTTINERLIDEPHPEKVINIGFKGLGTVYNYIPREYDDMTSANIADIILMPYLMNEVEAVVNGNVIEIGKESISVIGHHMYFCYKKFLDEMKNAISNKNASDFFSSIISTEAEVKKKEEKPNEG